MQKARLDVERQGLNKWEMHKALTDGLNNRYPRTHFNTFHIPDTKFGTGHNLADILRSHQTVFVKPIHAWGGLGITRIQAEIDLNESGPANAFLADLYHWQKQGEQPMTLHSMAKVLERFHYSYLGQPVIVQAGAPLATLNDRPFDIRVLMQRNDNEKWVYSGAVGRVGGAGSVVSNIALSHGEVLDVTKLCNQLECNRKTQQTLSKRLQETGHTVAKIVERYRDFFDVGIDVGLGPDNSLWIIEVNTDDALGGPSHELFAKLPNSQLYEEIQKRHLATRDRRRRALLRELF